MFDDRDGVQRQRGVGVADDLIERIDAVLDETTSRCGISGHDCSRPYCCLIAELLAGEAAEDDGYPWVDAMCWTAEP